MFEVCFVASFAISLGLFVLFHKLFGFAGTWIVDILPAGLSLIVFFTVFVKIFSKNFGDEKG